MTNAPSVLPSERSEFYDPLTGRRMIRWTSSSALDRHLYFTSQSVTADDQWLVVLSERDGHPNFFSICRKDGTIHRLTSNTKGSLRSYVYPSENRDGLGKSSPVLDPIRNVLYYIQGREIWRVALDDHSTERMFFLPDGWWTAFSHISPDGRWLCVPCTPPEAFPPGQTTQWEQLETVPTLIRENGFISRLYLINTQNGEGRVLTEVPFWVTHVNFSPDNSGRLLVNSEGWAARQNQSPRIWCVEPDGSFRPLFDQPDGMGINHENWAETENWIVYHGKVGEAVFVAAREWSGKIVYEYWLNDLGITHATPMKNPRQCVVDREREISIVETARNGTVQITDLCLHDSRPGWERNQDNHVHALQTPNGMGIVFSSNRDGITNIFEVRLDSFHPDIGG